MGEERSRVSWPYGQMNLVGTAGQEDQRTWRKMKRRKRKDKGPDGDS